MRALGVEGHAPRRHFAAALPEGDAAVLTAQPAPRRIVGVHHLEPVCSEVVQQLRLGAEVGVQGLVVIEVIAREIGEQSSPEREPVHAPLIEAVRRHFHGGAARGPYHVPAASAAARRPSRTRICSRSTGCSRSTSAAAAPRARASATNPCPSWTDPVTAQYSTPAVTLRLSAVSPVISGQVC